MMYIYGVLDKKGPALVNSSVIGANDKREVLSYLYRLTLTPGHLFHDFPADFVLVCLGSVEGDHIVATDCQWLDEMSDIKQAAEATNARAS